LLVDLNDIRVVRDQIGLECAALSFQFGTLRFELGYDAGNVFRSRLRRNQTLLVLIAEYRLTRPHGAIVHLGYLCFKKSDLFKGQFPSDIVHEPLTFSDQHVDDGLRGFGVIGLCLDLQYAGVFIELDVDPSQVMTMKPFHRVVA